MPAPLVDDLEDVQRVLDVLWESQGAKEATGSWTALALAADVVAVAGWATPQWRFEDNRSRVRLKAGALQLTAAFAAGKVLFTLPVGARVPLVEIAPLGRSYSGSTFTWSAQPFVLQVTGAVSVDTAIGGTGFGASGSYMYLPELTYAI